MHSLIVSCCWKVFKTAGGGRLPLEEEPEDLGPGQGSAHLHADRQRGHLVRGEVHLIRRHDVRQILSDNDASERATPSVPLVRLGSHPQPKVPRRAARCADAERVSGGE